MKSVGRSDHRTPAKHGVLDLMLGREAGVVRYASAAVRIPLKRLMWFDLTAGDGAVDGIGTTASPLLFAKHSLYRPGCTIMVQATELQPNTYATLLSNLARHLPHITNNRNKHCRYQRTAENIWVADDRNSVFMVLNADGLETRFAEYECGLGDWLFINNDPNHIKDWALSGTALAIVVDRGARVSMMTCMGCNVGGIKRLPREERDIWVNKVRDMNKIVAKLYNIDNLLVEIQNDAAQWAYLLTRPYKWTVDDDRREIARIYQQQNLAVKIFSLRDEPDLFEECLRRLFLWETERNA
jgi:hypothetical protein